MTMVPPPSPNPGSSGFEGYTPSASSPLPDGGAATGTTYSRARTAVILGILSLLPFSILAGIPAIVLGVLALRDIGASDGTLRGRGAAWCAIAMGVVSVLVFVLLFVVL
jgi:hypothetical protein